MTNPWGVALREESLNQMRRMSGRVIMTESSSYCCPQIKPLVPHNMTAHASLSVKLVIFLKAS